MMDQSLSDLILRELAELPQTQQEDVLAFVRFLKIGLADVETTAKKFDDAVEQARKIAESQGITEEDMENEIHAFRTKK